ncbi:MAG: hypothetical protein KJ718_06555 [Nanoarchaeota archaeon]|nr:hypothetical protein [Nanoarchaeota archaeon]MBU1052179.1 hypothetical protein [Nanoarchaeota archaeon]
MSVVPVGFALGYLGEFVANKRYSPLRNPDGLGYEELRARAIEEGRIKCLKK